jgi:hypothetical protein
MTVGELIRILSQCTDPDRPVTIGIKRQRYSASLDEVYLNAEGIGPNGTELVVALVNSEEDLPN